MTLTVHKNVCRTLDIQRPSMVLARRVTWVVERRVDGKWPRGARTRLEVWLTGRQSLPDIYEKGVWTYGFCLNQSKIVVGCVHKAVLI